MARNRNGIIMELDTLTPTMKRLPDELKELVRGVTELYAPRAATVMKNNAPWQDQTGLARMGLGAEAKDDDEVFSIVLYHTVKYGFWLEVRWSGRYAIINPTIEHFGPEVMSGLRNILEEIR